MGAISLAAAILGVVLSGGISLVALTLAGISVGVAVEEYVCNPDKTIITNNLNCNGHFECCDRATSKAPNEPYGYFNYGCYLILNAFNQIVCTSINEKGSQVEQVDHFTYNEGFTLFIQHLQETWVRKEKLIVQVYPVLYI